ncbi:SRPBCC family protein [Hyphobacterium sp. CCMP332]|nr:SRPBCC family protein [Hyphobacterium sp. CCMP332]
MLKKIGIGLLVVIALIVIISFFLPSEVTVERSIVVEAPVENIYSQVNDLHNWEKWSPWAEMDPDMKIEFFGPEMGKDAKYCWDGDPETVGKGCLTIVDNVDNASISTLLEFEGMSPGNGNWKFEKVSDGVKVSWAMTSSMDDFPVIGRYFGLAFDGMLGPDFEKGLSKLKSLSETMPTYSIDISRAEMPAMNYVSVRGSATMENISAKMGEMAGIMMEYMEKNGLNHAGAPFAIWHSMGEEFEFTFAMQVDGDAGEGNDMVKTGSMEAFECVKGDYYGAYEKMNTAYDDIEKYMEVNNLELKGESMEFYITDPMNEPDTAKWLTNIIYPIS